MNKRILLADDSLTIQKVVELTFMDESFEVEAVGSGDEAISSLERAVPSVLIADIHMPGASGYEVCRRAKELDPEIPVLLLVGTFEALDEDELVACGADGNLKKPFDSQELLQVVKEMAEARSAAAAEPAVEGFESTTHEAEAPEPAERQVTGYETTAFSLDPQPGDEPEFVPSAGFDFGGIDGDDEPSAAEAVADEAAAAPSAPPPDPEPMDELLGALDEVDSRLAPSAAAPPADTVEEAPEPEPAPAAPAPPAASAPGDGLSEADVERLARRVVELMSEQTVREVAWEVIPDLAEIVIKDRIRELEAETE